MTVTSCPLDCRSLAMKVPTLPAPTMTTFMPASLAGPVGVGQAPSELVHGPFVDQDVEHVTLLAHLLGGDVGLVRPGHHGHPDAVVQVEPGDAPTGPGLGQDLLHQ